MTRADKSEELLQLSCSHTISKHAFKYICVYSQVDFIMECGEDNKCFSNLQFTAELENLTRQV